MNRYITLGLLILSLSLTFSCRKKGEKTDTQLASEMLTDTTSVVFDPVEFRFDTITAGAIVKHDYKVTNTGTKDLIIAQARGSCGCTVPDYPKEPIKPGETKLIKVTFNSEGKQGEVKKKVFLMCNTEKRNEEIYISGFIRLAEDTVKK